MDKNNTITGQKGIGTASETGYRNLMLKLTFSMVFAVLMAVSANSFIYLPFTPVPITMQVLTVIFSSIMLGGPWALASQLLYISLGLAGLPVFAGFKSGPLVLSGPTAGYILGFAIAAYFCGYLYHNWTRSNKFRANTLITGFTSCITSVAIIYLFGYIHLFGFLYHLYSAQPVASILFKTWKLGIEPFIIMDFLKILIIINVLELGKKKS